MTWPAVTAPSALDLRELEASVRREHVALAIAADAEFDEVEALARAADPNDLFEPLNARWLRWFTAENPGGPGFLVIARDPADRTLTGHFLFYANPLRLASPAGACEFASYLYVHLYVRADQRRRGVFAGMFAFGQEVLARMGARYAYTVPNPRSSPGFAKFGVPRLGTLPVNMAPAWKAWLAASRSLVAGRAPAVDVERVEAFVPAMLPVTPGGARTDPEATEVRGVRTLEGLNWRFVRRPGAEYAIWRVAVAGDEVGYVVTRLVGIKGYRVLAIVDVDLRPRSASVLAQVLRAVSNTAEFRRANLVMAQGGERGGDTQRALAGAGLLPVPERILPQPVAVFGGPPPGVNDAPHLPALDRWRLTPGDWDVF